MCSASTRDYMAIVRADAEFGKFGETVGWLGNGAARGNKYPAKC